MEPFEKFQNAVKEAYLKQRQEEKLHYRLMSPSPANLRHYSKIRLEQNLTNEDLAIFAEYYNPINKYDNTLLAIKKTKNDKLRTLQNFLIGKTTTASEITTKLLAILIDFQQRPFNRKDWPDDVIPESGGENSSSEEEENQDDTTQEKEVEDTKDSTSPHIEEENQDNKTQDTNGEDTTDTQPPPIEEENQDDTTQNTDVENAEGTKGQERLSIWLKIINWLKGKKHQLLIAGPAILALSSGSIYLMTKKDCMCWNGEKYVEVNCKDKQHANPVIALDPEKLNYFQKIMRPDTLSYKDIGRIWYSRINHEVEFFTGAGHHPVHSSRSLKALTATIIQNRVLNNTKRSITTDSLQTKRDEK